MRDALIPTISLSATTRSSHKTINTTVSATEASFVDGAFAHQEAAATPQAAAASATPTPTATAFVLPGKTLGIFPTGLIITSAWTVMFVATVGAGTVERYGYRQTYRRRVRAETAAEGARRKPY